MHERDEAKEVVVLGHVAMDLLVLGNCLKYLVHLFKIRLVQVQNENDSIADYIIGE